MASDKKLSLKLYFHAASQKLLFAEAGKDFIDFLLGLLALPMGAIAKLLSKEPMVGSIANVFHTMQSLEDTYLQLDYCNRKIIDSLSATADSYSSILFPQSTTKSLYVCSRIHTHRCLNFSDVYNSICSKCRQPRTTEVKFDSAQDQNPGLVKGLNGVVRYIVMDDLSVMPSTSMNCIKLISNFLACNIGVFEERTVEVGFDEGVGILKASLRSKTVLTDTFLHNQDVKKEQ